MSRRLRFWPVPAGAWLIVATLTAAAAAAEPSSEVTMVVPPSDSVAPPAPSVIALTARSDIPVIGEFEPRLESPARWGRALYWAGAAADLYTTKVALDDSANQELNPLIGAGSDPTEVLVTAAAFKVGTYFIIRHFNKRGWMSSRRSGAWLGAFGAGQLGAAWNNHRVTDE